MSNNRVMRSPVTVRIVWTMLLLVAGGAAGAGGGRLWYEVFGPPWGQFGYEFEGWFEMIAGTGIGALTGAFTGWFLRDVQTSPRHLLGVFAGAFAGAVLLVVAVAYLGDLTNADPPATLVPYIALLGAPAAFLLWRWSASLARTRRTSR